MKKRLIGIFLCLIVCLSFATSSFAGPANDLSSLKAAGASVDSSNHHTYVYTVEYGYSSQRFAKLGTKMLTCVDCVPIVGSNKIVVGFKYKWDAGKNPTGKVIFTSYSSKAPRRTFTNYFKF